MSQAGCGEFASVPMSAPHVFAHVIQLHSKRPVGLSSGCIATSGKAVEWVRFSKAPRLSIRSYYASSALHLAMPQPRYRRLVAGHNEQDPQTRDLTPKRHVWGFRSVVSLP